MAPSTSSSCTSKICAFRRPSSTRRPCSSRCASLSSCGVVQARNVRPAVDDHGQALEVPERLFVAVVERERARVRLERRRVVPERILVEARDAVQKVDLLERVRRAPDLHFVHANELRPIARRLVDGLEHGGGAERIGVAVLDALERAQASAHGPAAAARSRDRARPPAGRLRGASRTAPRSGTESSSPSFGSSVISLSRVSTDKSSGQFCARS